MYFKYSSSYFTSSLVLLLIDLIENGEQGWLSHLLHVITSWFMSKLLLS